MNRRQWLASSLAVLAAGATRSFAQTAGSVSDLASLPRSMQSFVDAGRLAGAVCLVEREGRVEHSSAVGYRDLDLRDPMRADTVFQIMSQSKPFIAAAIIALQDEGALAIDDRVDRYLPEFADPWRISPEEDPSVRRLVPASGRITIRHLLSHTSGLPDGAPSMRAFPAKMSKSLGEVVDLLSQQPLESEPGFVWRYNNQAIAAAARVVEVVSGQAYDQFIAERFFVPLEMADSTFRPEEPVWPRIAGAYALAQGRLVELGPETPGGGELKYRRGARYILPEAGIYSTAADVAKFHRMFLNAGLGPGGRVLSASGVAQMLRPVISTPSREGDGQSQGLGWRIQTGPGGGERGGLRIGCFSHGGAFGSFGWGDPATGTVAVLLLQLPGASEERTAFVSAVNAASADWRST